MDEQWTYLRWIRLTFVTIDFHFGGGVDRTQNVRQRWHTCIVECMAGARKWGRFRWTLHCVAIILLILFSSFSRAKLFLSGNHTLSLSRTDTHAHRLILAKISFLFFPSRFVLLYFFFLVNCFAAFSKWIYFLNLFFLMFSSVVLLFPVRQSFSFFVTEIFFLVVVFNFGFFVFNQHWFLRFNSLNVLDFFLDLFFSMK